jgi:hypothetical protein
VDNELEKNLESVGRGLIWGIFSVTAYTASNGKGKKKR